MTLSCQNNDSQRRISTTLIGIVVMFFLLICPSEIVHFYIEVIGQDVMTMDLVLLCTNVLQTLNFSLNFLLYCVVNVRFRKTLRRFFYRYLLCIRCRKLSGDVERMNSVRSTRWSLISRPHASGVTIGGFSRGYTRGQSASMNITQTSKMHGKQLYL